MSWLSRMRGEAFLQVPIHGMTLTFYRQGMYRGLAVVVAMFLLLRLPLDTLAFPWKIGAGLVLCAGFYMAAALMGSRTPAYLSPEVAAARWL